MPTNTERSRLHRERKARGVKIVQLEIDGDIAEMLVRRGYLKPPGGARPVVKAADVAQAIQDKLRDEVRQA
jgi:hypothetical protein